MYVIPDDLLTNIKNFKSTLKVTFKRTLITFQIVSVTICFKLAWVVGGEVTSTSWLPPNWILSICGIVDRQLLFRYGVYTLYTVDIFRYGAYSFQFISTVFPGLVWFNFELKHYKNRLQFRISKRRSCQTIYNQCNSKLLWQANCNRQIFLKLTNFVLYQVRSMSRLFLLWLV